MLIYFWENLGYDNIVVHNTQFKNFSQICLMCKL